ALTFTAGNPWLMLATVLAWGGVAFGNVPGLQIYVVNQAQRVVPEAIDVASGLNIAAFHIGIPLGACGGGLIVADLRLIHTVWIGAIVGLLALGLTVWAGKLDQRDQEDQLDVKARPLAAC